MLDAARRGCFCVVAAIASACGCAAGDHSHFDADAWQAQRGVGAREDTRATQVSALTRRLKPGMTREEVRELLGELGARTDANGVLVEHRLSRG